MPSFFKSPDLAQICPSSGPQIWGCVCPETALFLDQKNPHYKGFSEKAGVFLGFLINKKMIHIKTKTNKKII